ncbi:sporulation protein YpjB [Paenibacillus sp. J2TS4]|uniref:sporulation protein YpjB n=1 Tax=Paenibacillus sp. J2TS4 TaxID=2807194 RepID=UPI001B2DE2D3|nr:sporulation protein YpjB [Paenibacillus sp. J2TS4]GIP32415.1 hypothetical protein J2TS4_16250 [Paenibacillus sp. J2TS4]
MFINGRIAALLIGCVIVIVGMTGCGQAQPSPDDSLNRPDSREIAKLEQVNRLADDMYRQTASGDIEGGKEKLADISDQLPKIKFAGIATLEGMNALIDTVEQAKRTFNSLQTSPEELMRETVKIRLVTDALTHPNAPMWLEFNKGMKSELRRMELAAGRQQNEELSDSLWKVEERYETIRASILVSREAADVEKLDSLLAFIKHQMQASPISYTEVMSAVKSLESTMDEVFYNNDDRTAYLPMSDGKEPILWSAAMGAIILTVLGFVAWKMFHSDKRFARVPRDR